MSHEATKEYEKLKKQLQQSILKKKTIDREITQIEEEIFQKETSYLSETNNSNIVRGFESQSKNPIGSSLNKKKLIFTDDDRIFSLSSHTFVRHLQKKSELDEEESNESTPAVVSNQNGSKKRKRAEQ